MGTNVRNASSVGDGGWPAMDGPESKAWVATRLQYIIHIHHSWVAESQLMTGPAPCGNWIEMTGQRRNRWSRRGDRLALSFSASTQVRVLEGEDGPEFTLGPGKRLGTSYYPAWSSFSFIAPTPTSWRHGSKKKKKTNSLGRSFFFWTS